MHATLWNQNLVVMALYRLGQWQRCLMSFASELPLQIQPSLLVLEYAAVYTCPLAVQY